MARQSVLNGSRVAGFNIDKDVERMIEKLAEKLKVSKSAVVRKAIIKYYELEFQQ